MKENRRLTNSSLLCTTQLTMQNVIQKKRRKNKKQIQQKTSSLNNKEMKEKFPNRLFSLLDKNGYTKLN